MSGPIKNKYARVAVKHAPLPKPNVRPMPTSFYGAGHTHGCAQCDVRIELCRCDTPEVDPKCATCKYGRALPWWPEDWLPKDCCRDHSAVADKKFRTERLLAGKERRWFCCSICGRTHPFDPADPSNDPPVTIDQWKKRFGDELPVHHWPHERGVPT